MLILLWYIQIALSSTKTTEEINPTDIVSWKHSIYILGHGDVVVITTTQICPTKPELRLSAGSNPAHDVSKIPNDDDLWQWSRLEIRLNVFVGQPYHKNN